MLFLIFSLQKFVHAGKRRFFKQGRSLLFQQRNNVVDSVFSRQLKPAKEIHSLATTTNGISELLSDCTDDLQRQRQQRRLNTKISMFIATLKACSGSRELERGKKTHNEVIDSGLISNMVLANTVVDMYAKCGSMPDAQRAFDAMQSWDVVSWTSLINGYVDNGQPEVGLGLFSRLCCSGCQPDASSYIAALKACTALAAREGGKTINGKVVKVSALENGMSLHAQAEKDGCMELFLASLLMTLYGKCGSLKDAHRVFQKMPQHDVVSCTAFMMAAAENGEESLTLDIFSQIRSPSAKTFLAALKACSSLAEKETGQLVDGKLVKVEALRKGVAVHSQATLTGFDSNVFVTNSLVDMYAKCSSLENSRKVFDKMQNRSVVSWNALIFGYAENGNDESALETFTDMRLQGFSANAQTYAAVIKACASLVALETGKALHAEVCKLGLEHEVGLDSCVVDFYGRCGDVVGAQVVFDSLATSKDPVNWTALIAGYSRQGDCWNMFKVFRRMQDEGLKPDGVTLLCLLTSCTRAGLVNKGEAYFRAMQSLKFGVSPGIDHYHCMIDMFCRENRLEDAITLLRSMPYEPNAVTWRTVLSGCKKWKNVVIGRHAFEALLNVDDQDSAGYLLMLSLYGSLGMWEEQKEIERLRKGTERNKGGRSWWCDERGIVHCFLGGVSRPECDEFDAKMKQVMEMVKEQGGFVGVDDGREGFICGHSERAAVVYGLVKTAPGTRLRVKKNLRVCDDCHRVLAAVSRFEQREIVCRDMSRFHVFRNGFCCCGDYW